MVYEVKDVVGLKVFELNNVMNDFEIYMEKVINIVIVVKDSVVDILGLY